MGRMIVGAIMKNCVTTLPEWTDNVFKFADKLVVVDDNSDDGTWEKLEMLGKYFAISGTRNPFKGEFKDYESEMRNFLWEKIRKSAEDGDWIMILDSDEFVSMKHSDVKQMMDADTDSYTFLIQDMWSDTEFRTDGLWSPWQKVMFKYKDLLFTSKKLEGGLHTGKVPEYVSSMGTLPSFFPIRHLSYHTPELRRKKFDYYMNNSDAEIDKSHASSIMDSENSIILKSANNEECPKILITSLVRDRAWILEPFLYSLTRLNYPKDKIGMLFVPNNCNDSTVDILEKFKNKFSDMGYRHITIKEINFDNVSEYKSHVWSDDGEKGVFKDRFIERMATMRNFTLSWALSNDYDYVFNVDSDILLHPDVLEHLVMTGKDIISPVFMGNWGSDKVNHIPNINMPKTSNEYFKHYIKLMTVGHLPQVWYRGGYETNMNWIASMFYHNGIHKVGGLGACTLISRYAIERGCNYSRIDNLPSDMIGEDRDFCVRARALGFFLYADTFYRLDHCEDSEDIKRWIEYHDVSVGIESFKGILNGTGRNT